jgi:hypothetical protein
MRFARRWLWAVCVIPLLMLGNPAHASTITQSFIAELSDGPAAGTDFGGTFSYDTTSLRDFGGTDYYNLTGIDFVVDGVEYTLAGGGEGREVIFQDGIYEYLYVADLDFVPPATSSPFEQIAFGFGGPGVIAYSTYPQPGGGCQSIVECIGYGSDVIGTAAVSEPSTLLSLALGLAMVLLYAAIKPDRVCRTREELRSRKLALLRTS